MTTITISSGVTSSGLSLSGVTLIVDGGGTLIDSILDSPGTVSSGGIVEGLNVHRHGIVAIYGSAIDLEVFGGGVATILGSCTSLTVEVGSAWIASGGALVDAVVTTNGRLFVAGTLDTVEVHDAASAIVDGGSLVDATIAAGGVLSVTSGRATGVVLASNNPEFAGAHAVEVVEGCGHSTSSFVRPGAALQADSGGLAGLARVSSGGDVGVESGGVAENDFVLAGGIAMVLSGGVLSNVTLSSGSTAYWYKGGAISGLTARVGAGVAVGFASATAVISGSVLEVMSRGMEYESVTLLGATASLGIAVGPTTSAGQAWTEITFTSSKPAAHHRALVAQSIATFGGGHAVTAPNAHSAGLTSAVAEMLKPR
jgi:hypothetical protein